MLFSEDEFSKSYSFDNLLYPASQVNVRSTTHFLGCIIKHIELEDIVWYS